MPALATLAVAGLLLGGCQGGAEPDAQRQPGGAPVSGGALTWAIETEPITFNWPSAAPPGRRCCW